MRAAPHSDRIIGIEHYATDTPGIGGVLRERPEYFQVEEVYEERGYEGGRYLVVEVEKTSWDTHRLIRELSRTLRISQKRFGWAGTKDKHAVTRQRISIANLDEEALERVRLQGVRIKVLGKTNRSVALGDLLGNLFTIRIGRIDLARDEMEKRVEEISSEIEGLGGLPNYFGVQRFGDVRPVTHLVGEALVRGDPETAVFTYLARPFPGELPETRAMREELWEDRDVSRALKVYPTHLQYELAVMNHLVQNPGDYAGAFGVLAPNLRRLFVHAYQSYLFNKILSRRLEMGIPISRAIPGDVVCFPKPAPAEMRSSRPVSLPDPGRRQRVDTENLEAVNRLAARSRAYVALPLIGHATDLSGGVQGEIERAVLEEEGVNPEDFRVSVNPDLGSPGTWRAALLRLSPDSTTEDGATVLRFFLPAGSYATVVTREYVKGG